MTRRHEVQEQIEIRLTEIWQGPHGSGLRHGFRPNVDSYHSDDPHELTVIVELPGVDPDALAVAVSARQLLVAGVRPRASGGGRVYQQMEIAYGPFERRIELPEDVDPTRARARYERGILTISLPIGEGSEAGARHRVAVERE